MAIVPPFDEILSAHRNRFGFRGVSEDKPGRFRARIGPDHAKKRSKYFSTPEAAARAYDRMARAVYGLRAFLNFPDDGERHVGATQEGFCKRGHLLIDAYIHNGKRHCRSCNRIARARADARKKAARGLSNEQSHQQHR